MAHDEGITVRMYVVVFLALMAFTALTVASAHADLGRMNVVVAIAIAVSKAVLVITYFMHLRFGPRLSRAIIAAGFAGLLLLMALTFDDVLTRTTTTYLPFIGALDGVRPPGSPIPPHPPLE